MVIRCRRCVRRQLGAERRPTGSYCRRFVVTRDNGNTSECFSKNRTEFNDHCDFFNSLSLLLLLLLLLQLVRFLC